MAMFGGEEGTIALGISECKPWRAASVRCRVEWYHREKQEGGGRVWVKLLAHLARSLVGLVGKLLMNSGVNDANASSRASAPNTPIPVGCGLQ